MDHASYVVPAHEDLAVRIAGSRAVARVGTAVRSRGLIEPTAPRSAAIRVFEGSAFGVLLDIPGRGGVLFLTLLPPRIPPQICTQKTHKPLVKRRSIGSHKD